MQTWFTYLAEDNLHVPKILTLLQAQIQNISIVIDDPLCQMSHELQWNHSQITLVRFVPFIQSLKKWQKIIFFEIINNYLI